MYVKDLATGDVSLVSASETGMDADGERIPSLANRDFVAFASDATNLVPGDTGPSPTSI